ncbi:hypothetical protein ACLRGI_14885 [Paenarthrobacter nitroguajacolicus]|uniref:hypothetical protein n=1 Tax=Paenarthrobacter nitroguajacolicus TaxID=211146 RepID=UPI003AE05D0C
MDLLARDAGGALWLYPGNGKSGWLPRGLVGSGWNAMNLIIQHQETKQSERRREPTAVVRCTPNMARP